MGTTANGLPYPEPTDAVADGANAIKALALAIDPNLKQLKFYASIVANSGAVGSTPLVITGLTTGPVATVVGRMYRVAAAFTIQTSVGTLARPQIAKDGVQVIAGFCTISVAGGYMPVHLTHTFRATAATHSWAVLLSTDTGTGLVVASGTMPAILSVEDLGT